MDPTAKFLEILKPNMARQLAQAKALRGGTVDVQFGEPEILRPGDVDVQVGMPELVSRTSPEDMAAADDMQARATAAMIQALRRRAAMKPGDVDVQIGLPEIVRR